MPLGAWRVWWDVRPLSDTLASKMGAILLRKRYLGRMVIPGKTDIWLKCTTDSGGNESRTLVCAHQSGSHAPYVIPPV